MQRLNTKKELQENYKRFGYSVERICADTGMSHDELHSALEMDYPDLANVWKLRVYLEDMLINEGKEVYPFSRLGDHTNYY